MNNQRSREPLRGRKLWILIFGMFLLVGIVGAADYKFQNDSGVNLVRISGENGNLTVLGNSFLGSPIWNLTTLELGTALT